MNRHSKTWFWLILALLLTAALTLAPDGRVHPANAAGSALGYNLGWFTIDGGGLAELSGGTYTLGGAIGQPDAGTLYGGQIALTGGFWGGVNTTVSVFLPFIKK